MRAQSVLSQLCFELYYLKSLCEINGHIFRIELIVRKAQENIIRSDMLCKISPLEEVNLFP